MYVCVNVKNVNFNLFFRNKKFILLLDWYSMQCIVCIYVIVFIGFCLCKCYVKYMLMKIIFYFILIDMKYYLFFGVVGGVYCRFSFEKKMIS